jgi:hypothetical protein
LTTATLVANKTNHVVEVKKKPILVNHVSSSFHLEARFIDLSNSFDKDVNQLLCTRFVDSHVPLASNLSNFQNVKWVSFLWKLQLYGVTHFVYKTTYAICIMLSTSKIPFSKATIHLGNHDHPIVDGMDKDTFQEIMLLVQWKKSCTPDIKNYVIALAAKKIFLARQLFNEDGDAPITMPKHGKYDYTN